MSKPSSQQPVRPQRRPKLLDRVRQALRRKHSSHRTEQAYIHRVKRYILFPQQAPPERHGGFGD